MTKSRWRGESKEGGQGDEIAPPKATLVQVLPPPVGGVNEREISMEAN